MPNMQLIWGLVLFVIADRSHFAGRQGLNTVTETLSRAC